MRCHPGSCASQAACPPPDKGFKFNESSYFWRFCVGTYRTHCKHEPRDTRVPTPKTQVNSLKLAKPRRFLRVSYLVYEIVVVYQLIGSPPRNRRLRGGWNREGRSAGWWVLSGEAKYIRGAGAFCGGVFPAKWRDSRRACGQRLGSSGRTRVRRRRMRCSGSTSGTLEWCSSI